MVAVSALPFALGVLIGVGAFAALTWYLVQESRRPVDWDAVAARSAPLPHVSHTRIAAVCVLFALWSVWATARPVSGWR